MTLTVTLPIRAAANLRSQLLFCYPFISPKITLPTLEKLLKMGNWKLEVGRMAMYMSFPVVLFHYFNQPTYFEEWVTNTKRNIIPPDNVKDREDIQQLIKDMRKKQIQSLEGE